MVLMNRAKGVPYVLGPRSASVNKRHMFIARYQGKMTDLTKQIMEVQLPGLPIMVDPLRKGPKDRQLLNRHLIRAE